MSEYPYQEVHPMSGSDGEPEPRNSVKTSSWRGGDKEICLRCGHDRVVLREFLVGSKSEKVMAQAVLDDCPACNRAIGGE